MVAARVWLPLAASICALAQPARIVSTFPSATETLFALGAGDRVVGVSNYCRYPPAAIALPKVGSYTRPDPERIALLRPDLVIIQKHSGALADRLAALNIRRIEIQIGSLADLELMIREIGAAIGSREKAEKFAADLHSQLESMRGANRNARKPKVLMVVGRTPGLLTNIIAAGPSTFLGELLPIAGGVNAVTDGAIAYPHISIEAIARMDADVILDMSMMGSGVEEARLREPWMQRPELTAVRGGAVFGVPSETLVTPGPRVVDAVRLIQSRLAQVNIAR